MHLVFLAHSSPVRVDVFTIEPGYMFPMKCSLLIPRVCELTVDFGSYVSDEVHHKCS